MRTFWCVAQVGRWAASRLNSSLDLKRLIVVRIHRFLITPFGTFLTLGSKPYWMRDYEDITFLSSSDTILISRCSSYTVQRAHTQARICLATSSGQTRSYSRYSTCILRALTSQGDHVSSKSDSLFSFFRFLAALPTARPLCYPDKSVEIQTSD